MTTTVKVCGITCIEDALVALETGADWIGLNLVGGPRRLDVDALIEIAKQLPDVSCAVALVPVSSDESFEEMLRQLANAGIRKLQLYGDVSPACFADFRKAGFETLAVLRAKDRNSLEDFSAFLSVCGEALPDCIVVDAYDEASLGGTGHRADWDMIADAKQDGLLAGWPPIILAGGLTPENVNQAIEALSPVGVDVSSGVESSLGKKDPAKLKDFIAAAKSP